MGISFANEEERLKHPLISKIPADVYKQCFANDSDPLLNNGVSEEQLALMQDATKMAGCIQKNRDLNDAAKAGYWVCFAFGHEDLVAATKIKALEELKFSSSFKVGLAALKSEWFKAFMDMHESKCANNQTLCEEIFHEAMTSSNLSILKRLNKLMPDNKWQELMQKQDIDALVFAVIENKKEIQDFILSSSLFVFERAEASFDSSENENEDDDDVAPRYSEIIKAYVTDSLRTLKERKQAIDEEGGDVVFDIQDAIEAKYYFYMFRHLIRRNDSALFDDMNMLASIPAVRELLTAHVPENDLQQIAEAHRNQAAILLLNVLNKPRIDFKRFHPSISKKLFETVNVSDMPSQLTFPQPLPTSHKDLKRYMLIHGDAYRQVVRGLADRLATWSRDHDLPVNWVEGFMKTFVPTSNAGEFHFETVFPLYTVGILSLEQVIMILESKDCPLHARETIGDILPFLHLCAPGAYTRFAIARLKLTGDLDVELNVMRTVIIESVTVYISNALKKENPELENFITESMEQHFGNVLANYFREELKFKKMEDVYSESHNAEVDRVFGFFLERFPEAFYEAYQASTIASKIATSFNMEEITTDDALDRFWERLNIYGYDPYFNPNDLIDGDLLYEKKIMKASANAENLLRLSIFIRLMNKGYLNNILKEVTLGKDKIYWYQDDVNLSHVITGKTRVLFKDYIKQLITENNIEKIEAINYAIVPNIKTMAEFAQYIKAVPVQFINQEHIPQGLKSLENIKSAENLRDFINIMPLSVLQEHMQELKQLMFAEFSVDVEWMFSLKAEKTRFVIHDMLNASELHELLIERPDISRFHLTLPFDQKLNYIFMLVETENTNIDFDHGRTLYLSGQDLQSLSSDRFAQEELIAGLALFGEDPIFNLAELLKQKEKGEIPEQHVLDLIEISLIQRCMVSHYKGFAAAPYSESNVNSHIVHLHPQYVEYSFVMINDKRVHVLDYCKACLEREDLSVLELLTANYFDKMTDAAEMAKFLYQLPPDAISILAAKIYNRANDDPDVFNMSDLLRMPAQNFDALIAIFDKDELEQLIENADTKLRTHFRYNELIALSSSESRNINLINLGSKLGIDYSSTEILEKIVNNVNVEKLNALGRDPYFDANQFDQVPAEERANLAKISAWFRLQNGKESKSLQEIKYKEDTIYINKRDFDLSYVISKGKRIPFAKWYEAKIAGGDVELQVVLSKAIDFSKNIQSHQAFLYFVKIVPHNELLNHVDKKTLANLTMNHFARLSALPYDAATAIIDLLDKDDLKGFYAKKSSFIKDQTLRLSGKFLDVLLYLLEKADGNLATNKIFFKNYETYTMGNWAVLHGNVDVVSSLITAKVDLNKTPDRDVTPLLFAVALRKLDILKILVKGNVADNPDFKSGALALELAKGKGDKEWVEMFKLLVDAQLDLNKFNPLIEAMKNENVQVFKEFVKAGADLYCEVNGKPFIEHLKQESDFHPQDLHLREKYNFAIVQIIKNQILTYPKNEWLSKVDRTLLEKSINLGLIDIHFAAEIGVDKDKLKSFMEYVGEDSVKDIVRNIFRDSLFYDKALPLSKEHYNSALNFLNADVLSLANKNYQALVRVAVETDNQEALKTLQSLGLNLTKLGAASFAAMDKGVGTLRFLAASGVDVTRNGDVSDNQMRTPVMQALLSNQTGAVKFLKEHEERIVKNQTALLKQFADHPHSEWQDKIDAKKVQALIDDNQLNIKFIKELTVDAKNVQPLIDLIGVNHLKKLFDFIVYNTEFEKELLAYPKSQYAAMLNLVSQISDFTKSGVALMNEAISQDNIEALTALKANHLDFTQEIGNEALFYAIAKRKVESVKWLIANNVDVTQRNQYGGTPISHAEASGNYEVVDLLRRRLAEIEASRPLPPAKPLVTKPRGSSTVAISSSFFKSQIEEAAKRREKPVPRADVTKHEKK